jgi:cytochrome P450
MANHDGGVEEACTEERAYLEDDLVIDPFPEMRRWQERGPLQEVNFSALFRGHRRPKKVPGNGRVFTALTYESVTALLNEPAEVSSTINHERYAPIFGRTLLGLDPPEHTVDRALVALAFRPKALDQWNERIIRPIVRAAARDLATKSSADLVEEFTLHFPMRVIAAILGMTDEFLPQFERWALDMFGFDSHPERSVQASKEMDEYCREVIAHKRAHPADDVVSSLVQAEIDGDKLSEESILAFMKLIFPAGGETTFRGLGNLIWCLVNHPDQLEMLQEDRSLVNRAIDESLRWQPVTACISPRIALDDLDAFGVRVPAESILYMAYGAANRDPARWSEPDRFDITREHLPHTTFAAGPHQCLGMHLARLEMREGINALLDVVSDLRFDPDAPEPHLHGIALRCPCALPVTYTPRPA